MKKVIRLTESELKNLVMNSALKVLKEDVLGDHFTQREGYDNTDVDTTTKTMISAHKVIQASTQHTTSSK